VTGQADPAVRFEVLGQLRAWRGETRLRLGPLQQRVLLAVLLLHANRPIDRARIINAVWGPAPPRYAVNLLQRHVSGLRRILEPARPGREPSEILTWADGCYVLTVEPGALDLAVFDREVGRARTARASGDLIGASEALHAASRLWRGPACYGLASPFLDAERNRLAERGITAVQERIEVDLALGRHLDVVAELQHLVADHPLRERLCGQLMVALYRSGRQAEALCTFQEVRRHLIDELGIEPAPELQRLQQQILVGDPALGPPPGDGAPARRGVPTGPGVSNPMSAGAVGRQRQAAACHEQAMRLWRGLGDRYDEAHTLIRLGDSHYAAGALDSAGAAWRGALSILDDVDRFADQLRARLDELSQHCSPARRFHTLERAGSIRAEDRSTTRAEAAWA
jgi:DNA-binding SARP family transcriptional activator